MNIKYARILIKNGEYNSNNKTYLEISCKEKNQQALEFLLTNATKYSCQYFYYACKGGSLDLVMKTLLKVTKNGDLELGYRGAYEGGRQEIVQFFLSREYSYYSYDLYYACKGGSLDLVNLLIQKGARNYDEGLRGAYESGSLELIQLMIKMGAIDDINWSLYWSCRGGSLYLVEQSIALGAHDFNWALSGACGGGHLDIVKLLIAKGANDFNTAFHEACVGGSLNIVKLLIAKGANILNEGISVAYIFKHFHIIKYLIKMGADCENLDSLKLKNINIYITNKNILKKQIFPVNCDIERIINY